MTRGLYIAVGVLGLMMVAGAGVTAAVALVPPGYVAGVTTAECVAAAVGVGLAWAGLVQARAAGEYEVRFDRRRGRELDLAPSVPELAFDCPGCGRTYRGGAAVAGRAFACRACGARFTVPGGPVGP